MICLVDENQTEMVHLVPKLDTHLSYLLSYQNSLLLHYIKMDPI